MAISVPLQQSWQCSKDCALEMKVERVLRLGSDRLMAEMCVAYQCVMAVVVMVVEVEPAVLVEVEGVTAL